MNTPQTPFTAVVQHDSLTVRHCVDGRSRTLCLVELARPYSVLLDGQAVACRTRHGQVIIQSPEGTDPAQLLSCISAAVVSYEQRRSWRTKAFGAASALVLVTAIAALFTAPTFPTSGFKINLGLVGLEVQPVLQAPQIAPAQPRSILKDIALAGASLPALKPPAPAVKERASSPATTEATHDGWTLPQSIRAELPQKLQMAAERKLFTVDYSSGHERTLYVFADPACPNCQRLEPALEAAAKGFNVIVFPVTAIGREKSIASITPVLCLPPEQRRAAWSDLFDIGHGVMDLGKAAAGGAVAPAGYCDIAGKALGVNEVAYQTYRIPGTPWVIADDGRHVPQDVLQDKLKLKVFMSDAEVSHAAQ